MTIPAFVYIYASIEDDELSLGSDADETDSDILSHKDAMEDFSDRTSFGVLKSRWESCIASSLLTGGDSVSSQSMQQLKSHRLSRRRLSNSSRQLSSLPRSTKNPLDYRKLSLLSTSSSSNTLRSKSTDASILSSVSSRRGSASISLSISISTPPRRPRRHDSLGSGRSVSSPVLKV